MPHYILIHDIAEYPETQDDWIDQWREINESAHGDVEWIQSFFDPTAGKIYCQWRGESVDAITECLPSWIHDQAPIIYSSEIILFDTLWLD